MRRGRYSVSIQKHSKGVFSMNLKRAFLIMFLFTNFAALCLAQNIGRIAILSFNGGSGDEGDGIAELFSFTPQLKGGFTVIPRTAINRAISAEQGFQLSGMTDSETITRLGNQFGADYVMAGSITSLGKSKLLIVSIVKIDVIQQGCRRFPCL
jgi:TolB-like protein